MNFTKLKDKIEEAAKQAFLEMFEKHGKEEIYAFALYSDGGAWTVCPSTNTMEHLAERDDDDIIYKYGTAEWKYEMEGADELFDEISDMCRNEVMNMEKDREIYKREFGKFQSQLYETCIEVLEKLKSENFFKQIVGKDVFLCFAVSDNDIDMEKERDMITRLNDNEYGKEYLSWMETWT